MENQGEAVQGQVSACSTNHHKIRHLAKLHNKRIPERKEGNMKHYTKTESDDLAMREFLMHHCPMNAHWCATGSPIPGKARHYNPEGTQRKRDPCKWYDKKRGCTHAAHP
jgi:hypothetical protein